MGRQHTVNGCYKVFASHEHDLTLTHTRIHTHTHTHARTHTHIHTHTHTLYSATATAHMGALLSYIPTNMHATQSTSLKLVTTDLSPKQ